MGLDPTSASALVVAGPSAGDNVTTPDPDFGWGNVGTTANGLSAVYLGNQCVLTARHVGFANVKLGSSWYERVDGTERLIFNNDGSTADLLIFRIETAPALPTLRLAQSSPKTGTIARIIGYGRGRAAPVEWTQPDGQKLAGWRLTPNFSKRWGTNRIAHKDQVIAMRGTKTRAIVTSLSSPDSTSVTTDEAQAAAGDSGGALFVPRKEGFDLAGIVFSVLLHPDQPKFTSFPGNLTYAADLFHYRDQILDGLHSGCQTTDP
jgi:hypothetical protein